VRRGLPALAALFLLAHLAALPPALDDIDAINFALGVRDFDVALHQPHPPGYPLFIALGKLSTPVLRAAGVPSPETRGLAVWSALGGSILLLLVFGLWRTLDGDPWRAAIAAVIAAASPLFWFTSLRPLSDVSGLCVAITALVMIVRALPAEWTAGEAPSPRALLIGAFLAGLAIGFRSQTVVLTAPLLAVVLLTPWSRLALRVRIGSLLAGAAGVALWAFPLVLASGGLSGYFAALGSQAGEDFSGVVMLWTNRTVPVAALALLNTFVLPWESPVLAGVVLALAAGGLLLLVVRAPRRLGLLAMMFGPYALFHLVFQETVTVRYALPLVLPIAYLISIPLTRARPVVCAVASTALVIFMLWLAVPAGSAYARTSSPIFKVLDDMAASPEPASVVGMHRRVWSESRRARRWSGEPPGHMLSAPRDYEWLELTRAWRAHDTSLTWFVADPRRTDLALIDPGSRQVISYRWPFSRQTYVGGARPDELELVTIRSPGWFLEQGWAITPEVAGIAERDGWGPHRRPSVGWIRRRASECTMMIGGRHLGGASDPPVRFHVALDDRPVLTFDVTPGFFLRFESLPSGVLDGAGPFAKLSVTADTASGGAVPRVAIEQFDVQAPDASEVGFDEGWYEPEYNPQTGRSWRWMSERATLAVHGSGDLRLTIAGESPLRYFARPSRLTVSVAGETVAVLELSRDFASDVHIPAPLLAKGNGRIVLASDQMFIPGDREGTGDRRHLAVRIYSVTTSPH
jgi:hypothetical protein